MLFIEKKHGFISSLSQLNKQLCEISDSFFPQMKPEKFGEKKGPELTENEKVILDILSKEESLDLNILKEQTGLSNKKWDKGIKGLRKHELVSVEKNEEGLTVKLVHE